MQAYKCLKKTVLIVDDSEDLRMLAAAVLRLGGYESVCVSDGLGAIAYLRRNRLPDAILLDLRMPRMNGWQFLAALSQDPEIEFIPVIIYSSESLSELWRDHERPSNVVACIAKTVGNQTLLNTLNQVVVNTAQ